MQESRAPRHPPMRPSIRTHGLVDILKWVSFCWKEMNSIQVVSRKTPVLNIYVITLSMSLVLCALHQNGIKRIQSVFPSYRTLIVLQMVQTRKSSCLTDVDADDKSDELKPPLKKTKVSGSSGMPDCDLLSIISNTPIIYIYQRYKPKFWMKLRF